MSFITEIKDRLVAQSVGTFTGASRNIFIGARAVVPAGDGPYLSLVVTPGTDASRTQNNTATERPTAQISTRAATYVAAYAMAKAAYDALGGANGLYNLTLSGTFYVSVVARQTPGDIGQDAAGRPMLSFNIDTEKQPS